MKHIIVLYAVVIITAGCSSADDNQPSEFENDWILTSYTLDDGTMKSVPNDIQNEGSIGLFVLSDDSLTVSSGLCENYLTSYQLDNDVLSTSNAVFPEGACTGFYGDADNTERSELLRRTFLNSQTLISVSNNTLTITTLQNEDLQFQRSAM